MYHGDEGSVDVELLAECGQIAQRLRSLERSWSIELKELQKKSLKSFGKPPLSTSLSLTQKLNEIFDNNEHDTLTDNKAVENDSAFANRLRYLEDIAIKIHNQEELLRKSGVTTTTTTDKQNFHSKKDMNYSAASEKSNSNDFTTSPTGNHELSYEQLEACQDNNSKSTANEESGSESIPFHCSSYDKQQQNIYHQQQQLCAKVTSDDLKMLLRELKRKVDFTEKMNWLCKSHVYLPRCSVLNL